MTPPLLGPSPFPGAVSTTAPAITSLITWARRYCDPSSLLAGWLNGLLACVRSLARVAEEYVQNGWRETRFQWATNRKWHVENQMVTCPITSCAPTAGALDYCRSGRGLWYVGTFLVIIVIFISRPTLISWCLLLVYVDDNLFPKQILTWK